MKWIAYFFVVFFLIGCNHNSKEDLELLKEQAEVIHYENTIKSKVIRATLLENGTKVKTLNQLHRRSVFYQNTYCDSSFIEKQDSIQLLFNTKKEITNRLDLSTLYYNYAYNTFPTEEYPHPLVDSNFLIQTKLVNDGDSLEIQLYITSNPKYNPKYIHKELLTTTEIINKIEQQYECKTLIRSNEYFANDNRPKTLKLKKLLNDYLLLYNYDTISNRQKSFRLNKLESEFHSSFNKDYFKKRIKTTTTNSLQIQLNKIDFLKYYRNIFPARCIKFPIHVPNTTPKVPTVLDFEYLIKKVSILGNSETNNRYFYKGYYTTKVATKDIKTDYIQLEIEFEQEFNKPKHYKTNKVPFQIIAQ